MHASVMWVCFVAVLVHIRDILYICCPARQDLLQGPLSLVHFKQLFKMKGNYDEGFGREQHKAKWVKKEDGGDEDEVAEL